MVHTKYLIDLIYGLVNLTHIKLSKITIAQIEEMKELLSLKEKQHFFGLYEIERLGENCFKMLSSKQLERILTQLSITT